MIIEGNADVCSNRKFIRTFSDKALENFKNDIHKVSWQEVINLENLNDAYNHF